MGVHINCAREAAQLSLLRTSGMRDKSKILSPSILLPEVQQHPKNILLLLNTARAELVSDLSLVYEINTKLIL